MRIIFNVLFLLSVTSTAFAYSEGTISCKNVEGLPENTYKIENVTMAGTTLPYLEVNRFYRGKEGQPARQSTIRGLAVVSSFSRGEDAVEILSLASFRLEFVNGELAHCRK